MQIKISNEADRLTVATILIKNGYKVYQTKKKKTPGSKVNVSYLNFDEMDGENIDC